ncbi:hypothetical protein ACVGVM_06830 [Pseudonocardia bannensis]|uniref:Uncharacterized protein n=1 Tax=Pseudonocardia bannensis TaxID=630973 RepID=A0A848DGF4_9PSEU|nr:hypothetical protein [Pseudonocardia bannensis]NMH91750.1 hypothetical protein [Pseudonocardia bannensis]
MDRAARARRSGRSREQWARLRRLTDRPFAVNHQMRPFGEEAFAATLDARVPIVSFHMGVPAALIARVPDSGALAVQQVMDRRRAEAAGRAGADVTIAVAAPIGAS